MVLGFYNEEMETVATIDERTTTGEWSGVAGGLDSEWGEPIRIFYGVDLQNSLGDFRRNYAFGPLGPKCNAFII